MLTVHPTALVSPDAVLGAGVTVGAFSIIEDGVHIGAGSQIAERVIVRRGTSLGERVRVYPGAVLGEDPQHLKYDGKGATVTIGDDTVIREMVTVNRGTELGGNRTTVGPKAFIMAYCHVAHDCHVGEGVIMANGCQLAGHVEVQDYSTLGGVTLISQFCRVGRYAFIGAGSMLRKDVPPFVSGKGGEFEIKGINTVGLERRGFSPASIQHLRTLFRIFYIQKHTVSQAIEKASTELGDRDEISLFLNFVRASKMGIHR
jgi:UDP-N-acetylglucosamine acyltransferase